MNHKHHWPWKRNISTCLKGVLCSGRPAHASAFSNTPRQTAALTGTLAGLIEIRIALTLIPSLFVRVNVLCEACRIQKFDLLS